MSKSKIETVAAEAVETTEPALFDEGGFCIAEGIKRIENNTDRLINLPFIESAPDFPNGIKLWPGLTTVPMKYWVALEQYTPDTQILCGSDEDLKARYLDALAAGKRKPSTKLTGLDTIKYLLTPTKIVKADGVYFGPQITVYDPEQCDRPDGPPLPDTLAAYNDATALKLIAGINRRDILEKWAKTETDPRRAAVREAATTKLASLR